MIGENIEAALNDQLNHEFFSWYTYLGMSSYFEGLNLHGFGRWMGAQSRREMTHALKIYGFLHDQNASVVLKAISEPSPTWESPLAAVVEAYHHEQEASGRINDLVDLAVSERAHATNHFLQWFVEEQVEEESHLRRIVKKLELVAEDRYGLFLIDRDLKRS